MANNEAVTELGQRLYDIAQNKCGEDDKVVEFARKLHKEFYEPPAGPGYSGFLKIYGFYVFGTIT